MSKYEEIGNRVLALREGMGKGKGRSQEELLAELVHDGGCCANMGKGTLSKIEQGKGLPPTDFLIGLDTISVATPDYILFGEERLPVFQLSGILSSMTEDTYWDFIDKLYRVVASTPLDSPCPNQPLDKPGEWTEAAIIDVSRRLREIRGLRHLRQKDVAKLLSFSRNEVSANERILDVLLGCKQSYLPSTSYILAFCQKMDTSAAYLLDSYFSIPRRLLAVQSVLADFSYNTQCQLVEKIMYSRDFF